MLRIAAKKARHAPNVTRQPLPSPLALGVAVSFCRVFGGPSGRGSRQLWRDCFRLDDVADGSRVPVRAVPKRSSTSCLAQTGRRPLQLEQQPFMVELAAAGNGGLVSVSLSTLARADRPQPLQKCRSRSAPASQREQQESRQGAQRSQPPFAVLVTAQTSSQTSSQTKRPSFPRASSTSKCLILLVAEARFELATFGL